MVDTVRNSPNAGTSTVHDQRKSRAPQADQSHSSSMADKSTASAPSVSVDLSVSEKVKALSTEPPVNIEVVTEIRQTVSEGSYPSDLNASTKKLSDRIQEV